MPSTLVDAGWEWKRKLDRNPFGRTRRQEVELELQNARMREALRAAEFLLAIDASTTRVLRLALRPCLAGPDPELL